MKICFDTYRKNNEIKIAFLQRKIQKDERTLPTTTDSIETQYIDRRCLCANHVGNAVSQIFAINIHCICGLIIDNFSIQFQLLILYLMLTLLPPKRSKHYIFFCIFSIHQKVFSLVDFFHEKSKLKTCYYMFRL